LLSLHAGRHAFFLCLEGSYGQATDAAEESIQAAIEINDLTDYSIAHFFEAWALLHAGHWGRFRKVVGSALGRATKDGHELWSVQFRLLEAWLYLYADVPAYALPLCEQCAERAHALAHPLSRQMSAVLLGQALTGTGNYHRAYATLREVRDWQCRERVLMDWIWRVPLQFAFTELWLRQGDTTSARREAAGAVEAAEATPEKTWRGLARWYVARVSTAAGNLDSARKEIGQGLEITEGYQALLARWRLYALAHEVFGDETARTQATSLLRILLESLDTDDPASGTPFGIGHDLTRMIGQR
jgi:tetratricopeptide (TPR) repeat protein